MDNNCQEWYGGADISLAEAKEKEVSCEFTMQKDTDNDSKMLISMGKSMVKIHQLQTLR